MFKIHKKIKYALISLKYIAAKPRKELTTAKEICSRFDIPFDPTSRVLQIMAQSGVLRAEQGAYGGYCLIKDPAEISLFDLSRMIVGPFAITDCCNDHGDCDRISICVLKDTMGRLNNRLLKVFKEVKTSEMI